MISLSPKLNEATVMAGLLTAVVAVGVVFFLLDPHAPASRRATSATPRAPFRYSRMFGRFPSVCPSLMRLGRARVRPPRYGRCRRGASRGAPPTAAHRPG